MNSENPVEAAPPANRTAVAITIVICVTCLAAFALWIFKPVGEKPPKLLDPSIYITTHTAHLYRHGQFHSVIDPWVLVQNMRDLPDGWVRVKVNAEEFDLGRSHLMQATACRTKLVKEIREFQAKKEKLEKTLLAMQTDASIPALSRDKRGVSQIQLNIEETEKQIRKRQEVVAIIDQAVLLYPAGSLS